MRKRAYTDKVEKPFSTMSTRALRDNVTDNREKNHVQENTSTMLTPRGAYTSNAEKAVASTLSKSAYACNVESDYIDNVEKSL